jgi:hypothetical protein
VYRGQAIAMLLVERADDRQSVGTAGRRRDGESACVKAQAGAGARERVRPYGGPGSSPRWALREAGGAGAGAGTANQEGGGGTDRGLGGHLTDRPKGV